MYCIGTGKFKHGLRITIILDEDSRFILGFAIGNYHKEKVKKGEKYSELEKTAIIYANNTVQKYGMDVVKDSQKSVKVSSFFSSLKAECIECFYCNSKDELQNCFDNYLKYYNFERIHSGLQYKTPYEILQNKIVK